MARLILDQTLSLYEEYEPVGIEKYVEEKLDVMGTPLGYSTLAVDDTHVLDGFFCKGYQRGSVKRNQGIHVGYERYYPLFAQREISRTEFWKRMDEEAQVHQILSFQTEELNSDFLYVSSYRGITEFQGTEDFPFYDSARRIAPASSGSPYTQEYLELLFGKVIEIFGDYLRRSE